MSNDKIAELVEKYKSGDRNAFDILYNETKNDFFRYASRLSNDSALIEDALQETYIKIASSISSLENPIRFKAWGKKILRNNINDSFRKNSHDVIMPPANFIDDNHSDFFEQQESDDIYAMPGVELERQEVEKIIRSSLDNLTPVQRQTAIYYYYDEMSIKEIALLMNCSTGTVKSRLNSAREKLRLYVVGYETAHGFRIHAFLPFALINSALIAEDLGIALSAASSASIWAGIKASIFTFKGEVLSSYAVTPKIKQLIKNKGITALSIFGLLLLVAIPVYAGTRYLRAKNDSSMLNFASYNEYVCSYIDSEITSAENDYMNLLNSISCASDIRQANTSTQEHRGASPNHVSNSYTQNDTEIYGNQILQTGDIANENTSTVRPSDQLSGPDNTSPEGTGSNGNGNGQNNGAIIPDVPIFSNGTNVVMNGSSHSGALLFEDKLYIPGFPSAYEISYFNTLNTSSPTKTIISTIDGTVGDLCAEGEHIYFIQRTTSSSNIYRTLGIEENAQLELLFSVPSAEVGDLIFSDNNLYFTDEQQGTLKIYRLNILTLTLTEIPTSSYDATSLIASDGQYLYVSSNQGIEKINTEDWSTSLLCVAPPYLSGVLSEEQLYFSAIDKTATQNYDIDIQKIGTDASGLSTALNLNTMLLDFVVSNDIIYFIEKSDDLTIKIENTNIKSTLGSIIFDELIDVSPAGIDTSILYAQTSNIVGCDDLNIYVMVTSTLTDLSIHRTLFRISINDNTATYIGTYE